MDTNQINQINQTNHETNSVHNQSIYKFNDIGIDIGIPCTMGCEQFLYICILTLIKTAHNPKRLKIHVGIDLHYMSIDVAKKQIRLKMIQELVPDVNIVYVQTKLPHSSLSHGYVLNKLFTMFAQPYGILCDSDLGFLYYGWDNLFLSKINDKIKAVGVHTNDYNHLRKFPTLHCVMFDNKIVRDLQIDFCPEGTNLPVSPLNITADNIIGHLYKVPVGTLIKLDTGSQLCRKYIENNYDGYYFPCFNSIFKNDKHCKFLTQFLCDKGNSEYHDDMIGGDVILTHHQASVKRAVVFKNKARTDYKIVYKLPVSSVEWIRQIAEYLFDKYIIDIRTHVDLINNGFN